MKRLVAIVLIAILSTSTVYAQPKGYGLGASLGRFFNNVVMGKTNEKIKDHRKMQEKLDTENEYEKTIELLDEKLEEGMTNEQIDSLKILTDMKLGGAEQKHYTQRSKKISQLKSRLKNKKLGRAAHQTLRRYLENLPDLKGKSEEEVAKTVEAFVNWCDNPHSDINHTSNQIMFFPTPTIQVPTMGTMPALAY